MSKSISLSVLDIYFSVILHYSRSAEFVKLSVSVQTSWQHREETHRSAFSFINQVFSNS